MTLVAVLCTVVVVFKISGNAAKIAFGIWAVVFSLIVVREAKQD